MSVWTTPKENWALDEGVLLSDMNRVEGNINFLFNTYQLSGFVLNPVFEYIVDAYIATIAKICIIIPNGYSLKILRVSYFSSNANVRYAVKCIVGGSTTSYITTLQSSEDSPNFILYSNTTGDNVTATIQIDLRSSSNGYFDPNYGCLAFISKETTV